jgi:hypothetical protein
MDHDAEAFVREQFAKNTDKTEEMYIRIAAGMIRQEWIAKNQMETAVKQMQRALDACMQGKKQLEDELKTRR